MIRLKLLLGMLVFGIATLLLSAPATAWKVHEVAHSVPVVAADEHHHHDELHEAVEGTEAAHPRSSGEDSSDDSGHDHLPSLSSGLGAVLAADTYEFGPVAAAIRARETPVRVLIGKAGPPKERPPRSV